MCHEAVAFGDCDRDTGEPLTVLEATERRAKNDPQSSISDDAG